jgi:hypothetical protein
MNPFWYKPIIEWSTKSRERNKSLDAEEFF